MTASRSRADDVVWSFDVLKEYNPQQAFYYRT